MGEGRAGQGERPRDCRRTGAALLASPASPCARALRGPGQPQAVQVQPGLHFGGGWEEEAWRRESPRRAEAAGSRSSSVCGMSPGPASAGRRLGSEAGITPSRVQDAVDVTSDQAVRFTQIHREAGAERSCCRCGPRRLVREILRCPKCL